MDDSASRSALGVMVPLGTLYDGRKDQFVATSLFKAGYQMTQSGATTTINPLDTASIVRIVSGDGYQTKLDCLDISPDQGASIIAGLVKPKGSGVYFSDAMRSNNILQAAVVHKVTVMQEKLHIMRVQPLTSIDISVLAKQEATHFVTGLEWGIRSIIAIKHQLTAHADRTAVEAQFNTEVEDFKSAVEKFQQGDEVGRRLLSSATLPLEIVTYSDVFESSGVLMKDLREAYDHITMIPLHIEQEYLKKGRVLMYKLLPLSMIGLFLEAESVIGSPYVAVSAESTRKFVSLFDEFVTYNRELSDYYDFISLNRPMCSAQHLQEIHMRLRKLQRARRQMEERYAETLLKVRSGKAQVDQLESLYRSCSQGENSPSVIAFVAAEQRTKIEFAISATRKGAIYVESKEAAMRLMKGGKAGIIFYSQSAMKDHGTWQANKDLFEEMLNDREPDTIYIVADLDPTVQELPRSYLSVYENGTEVSENILDRRRWMAESCLARYDISTLETHDIQRPIKRRFIVIPCPNPHCDGGHAYKWFCYLCSAPIEFGFTDRYLYCDCGRSLYSNYDFKCNQSSHGPEFERYDQQELLSLLEGLAPSDNVNILILGETGVGKSTFINAFVNYLTFESLDDAKAADQFHSVIPCSFSTQIMNRDSPDGEIKQIKIQVGVREDEKDGSKGASATQQTTVYPVTIGDRTIRLVDTPGIGDTRGIQYDKKNMADILATLSSYDELHGILILLKSNNSRLTVTFNFCMKELLTHLHRSAARNVAFGFTNTRISNYTPGDTFGPLSALLEDHSDIGLHLNTHTTYCFDSESFRYLAAFKQGVLMENGDDFRRSWQHSREETLKLVNYFKTKPPYRVQSTISLNGTRRLILDLTKPMADISNLIRKNIAMSNDKIAELRDVCITMENLRRCVNLQIINLRTRQLDEPRTVCKASRCIELKDDGSGEYKKATIYKSHCHPVCSLKNIRADQVAHPELIHCSAFNGHNHCQKCGHHWQSHLHVLYELEEYMTTVTDVEVERQLRKNAHDVALRQTAIKKLNSLIEEYKAEHEMIQDTAARFALFLKQHSITPYNDAKLAYLEMRIREEEAKVRIGGNRTDLDTFMNDRAHYEKYVEVLTRMNDKYSSRYLALNEVDVARNVEELYDLKHFGKNLQSVKNTVSSAHQSTYRERPYRIKIGGRYSEPKALPYSSPDGDAHPSPIIQPTTSPKKTDATPSQRNHSSQPSTSKHGLRNVVPPVSPLTGSRK
ncbi:hypothetical protein O1611_g3412 [Lasiodiplodia mahajangana]|uniref:Uncharacterized protein n=1 Tax=Lasiodiplodia mahajangana TaxID=1108764 RepID=A0ACC2JRV7_9PEZI|nr:hypothetical protein O1611_g3412 [Lasiodiplodia mahajangana]